METKKRERSMVLQASTVEVRRLSKRAIAQRRVGLSYAGFWVMGDQAAWFAGASMTSMPSRNLTPPMTFGN